MMKKIVVGILIILLFGYNVAFATSGLTDGVEIKPQNQFGDVGNSIFGIVRVVGIICSVAALMLIGIKYMLASAEEKAEYKKTFFVFGVGILLVFGVTYFAEILYNWITSVI